jgi:hypothetical protein
MKLSSRQRSFILNEQILIPFVANFAFNAGDAWLAFRHFAPIPMWTLPGVALDLIGAIPGLPFILCLITTPLVKRAARKGKVEPLPKGPQAYAVLRRLPSHNFWRAALLGTVSQLVISPVLLLTFLALGLDRLSLDAYIILKGTLCGVLAAVISPITALFALAQYTEQLPAGTPLSLAQPPLDLTTRAVLAASPPHET